jgi:predicted nuclease of predicted toxin-antitoxin system
VRLLVDQNLAGRVAAALRDAGHDAVHVADRGLAAAEDQEVLALALEEQRVIVSEDTDFGALLAHAGAAAPSFVLLRAAEPLDPERQATLLIANLPAVEEELRAGAIVVLSRGRIRVRRLPIEPSG